jgi:subtilisin family serine protease
MTRTSDRDPVNDHKVVVAVLDTGIGPERTDKWLDGVSRPPERRDPLDEFPAPGGNQKLDFAAGHGTFAAGIVEQVDPMAEIRVYRVLDSDGFVHEIALACEMIKAAKAGAHVINLSLGMRTLDNQPCLAFEAALDVIDEISEDLGSEPPVIVASAGNYGTDDPVWPAASRRVISVAGLTSALQPASWSSRGFWVDLSTVGEGVISTFVEGEEDPVFADPASGGSQTYPDNARAVWSGTSFAAPQIAGAIARTCRTHDGQSPRVAARRLLRTGVPIAQFGRGLQLLPGS